MGAHRYGYASGPGAWYASGRIKLSPHGQGDGGGTEDLLGGARGRVGQLMIDVCIRDIVRGRKWQTEM